MWNNIRGYSGFLQSPDNEDGIVPNTLQQQREQLQPFGFAGYQTRLVELAAGVTSDIENTEVFVNDCIQ